MGQDERTEDSRLRAALTETATVSRENERLRESLADLAQVNRLRDQFVATVSHELRTPLTSILGYTRLLLRGDVSLTQGDVQAFIQIVERHAGRLHRMIEDLLTVSQVESSPPTPAMEPVAIEDLLGDILAASASHQRPIEVTVSPSLPPVTTDSAVVRRIVENLLDNALKFSPGGAPVRVEAGTAGGAVFVRVEDEGRGVPPELHERIFERFYQVDQSLTRSVGGAGLGLYLCRRLAESIGGRVVLQRSSPGGGSVFTLWIPASPRARRAIAHAGREPAKRAG